MSVELLSNLQEKAWNSTYVFMIVIAIVTIIAGIAFLIWYIKREKSYNKLKIFLWKTIKDKQGHEMPIFVGHDKGRIVKDKKHERHVLHVKGINADLGQSEDKHCQGDYAGISLNPSISLAQPDINALQGTITDELNIPSIPCENGGSMIFVEVLGARKFAIGEPYIFDGNVKVLVSSADIAEGIFSYREATRFYDRDKLKWVGTAIFVITVVLTLVIIAMLINKIDTIKEIMMAGKEMAQATGAMPVTGGGG